MTFGAPSCAPPPSITSYVTHTTAQDGASRILILRRTGWCFLAGQHSTQGQSSKPAASLGREWGRNRPRHRTLAVRLRFHCGVAMMTRKPSVEVEQRTYPHLYAQLRCRWDHLSFPSLSPFPPFPPCLLLQLLPQHRCHLLPLLRLLRLLLPVLPPLLMPRARPARTSAIRAPEGYPSIIEPILEHRVCSLSLSSLFLSLPSLAPSVSSLCCCVRFYCTLVLPPGPAPAIPAPPAIHCE